MSADLTKNARWVVLWLRCQSKDTIEFKPFEIVMNLGRWSYDVPEEQVIAETIDATKSKILARNTYLVDIELFPYSQQHKEVTKLAEQYFKRQRIVT